MKKLLTILVLSIALNGCANTIRSPSPLVAMQNPATNLGSFTDTGVILYAAQALDSYDGGSLTNEILALGGAVAGYGLGTAAVALPLQARGFLLGVNSLLALGAIWRPVDRSTLYSQGAGLIRESLGTYVMALRLEGYCTVPNDRITISGAILFSDTNGVIQEVENRRAGIIDLGSRGLTQLQTSRAKGPMITRETVIPEGCK